MKMKSLILTLCLAAPSVWAADLPIEFHGRTSAGEECTLVVESWRYTSETRHDWTTLEMVVSTPWQLQTHPALTVRRSSTPFALYAENRQSRDKIAIDLKFGGSTPSDIRAFSFQSHTRGLFQAHCRFDWPTPPATPAPETP